MGQSQLFADAAARHNPVVQSAKLSPDKVTKRKPKHKPSKAKVDEKGKHIYLVTLYITLTML
jgi:hypothetical protein